MHRTFFIHGFTEDGSIFDRLIPLLGLEKPICVYLKNELKEWSPAGRISVESTAAWLVQKYKIDAQDLIIGHSMGGWIAIHVKQIAGSPVVQLASFTDQQKIFTLTRSLFLLKALVRLHILQSATAINYLKKKYPFDESRALNDQLGDVMAAEDPGYLIQQFEILFRKAAALTVVPDLRIHATPDNIVAPPDEPFVVAPGDHYSLVFHPEFVAGHVTEVLKKLPFNVFSQTTAL